MGSGLTDSKGSRENYPVAPIAVAGRPHWVAGEGQVWHEACVRHPISRKGRLANGKCRCRTGIEDSGLRRGDMALGKRMSTVHKKSGASDLGVNLGSQCLVLSMRML